METFTRKLRTALDKRGSFALQDPGWPKEWKAALATVAAGYTATGPPAILIPTSGTTGVPKYCIHTSDTLTCSAKAYATRFGARGIIHAVNVLPLHHVGGLMPLIRSMECGGKVHHADYRDHENIRSAPFPLEQASISVVPTQLRRMLGNQNGIDTLGSFALIFVGGAACPADLLDKARSAGLRLCPCYGSTETSAMVTALEPEEFLAGAQGAGTPMPHVKIEIDSNQRVLVRSESITHGYLPKRDDFRRTPFPTGDLGHIDDSGHLHIHGRADRVIITGGENVHPEQVEAAALATGLVRQARCRGVPNPEWGMRVELEICRSESDANWEPRLLEALKERLPNYAVPKAVHQVEAL